MLLIKLIRFCSRSQGANMHLSRALAVFDLNVTERYGITGYACFYAAICEVIRNCQTKKSVSQKSMKEMQNVLFLWSVAICCCGVGQCQHQPHLTTKRSKSKCSSLPHDYVGGKILCNMLLFWQTFKIRSDTVTCNISWGVDFKPPEAQRRQSGL